MRAAVAQQSSRAQDPLRRFVACPQEELDRDRFAGRNAVEHREVARREKVVAVLAIDALEALRDDQPDAGGFLRKRARLARRAFAIALAGDDHLETTVPESVAPDRLLIADLESDVRDTSKAIVVVQHEG